MGWMAAFLFIALLFGVGVPILAISDRMEWRRRGSGAGSRLSIGSQLFRYAVIILCLLAFAAIALVLLPLIPFCLAWHIIAFRRAPVTSIEAEIIGKEWEDHMGWYVDFQVEEKVLRLEVHDASFPYVPGDRGVLTFKRFLCMSFTPHSVQEIF